MHTAHCARRPPLAIVAEAFVCPTLPGSCCHRHQHHHSHSDQSQFLHGVGAGARGARWGRVQSLASEQRAGPLLVLLFLLGAGGGSPMEMTKKQKKFSFGADPALFHGAVLMAGYPSPTHSMDERAQEGSEVAIAAATGSRVHAVLGSLDTCCPIEVCQSYFDAMRAGGVRVHTLADANHSDVYKRIALGKRQGDVSVLGECRRALLPERTVQTIHV